jgi:putative membrane protein
LPLVIAIGVVAVAYAAAAWRQRGEPRGWNAWRTTSFLAGIAVLAVAALPTLSPWPAGDFRGHVAQHLMIGMVAPIGLVLGAPLTLALRTVPRPWGRRVGRVLHSRPARVVSHPVTALTLSIGGMVALYCTPLYEVTASNAVAHHLAHAHFLASGYLFAWVIAGPDPAPRRPSVPARLVLLGVAIVAHSALSQLLYAGVIDLPAVPAAERRGAAELMYYGGDIAELLLAMAMLTAWRPRVPVTASRGSPR